ncbi:MAG: hypothetical protein F6K11_00865 [Leptolyngbya sp. SIO3F4]|nr:hypothetical protein [Leptolyngbya sp. SIO3F4]
MFLDNFRRRKSKIFTVLMLCLMPMLLPGCDNALKWGAKNIDPDDLANLLRQGKNIEIDSDEVAELLLRSSRPASGDLLEKIRSLDQSEIVLLGAGASGGTFITLGTTDFYNYMKAKISQESPENTLSDESIEKIARQLKADQDFLEDIKGEKGEKGAPGKSKDSRGIESTNYYSSNGVELAYIGGAILNGQLVGGGVGINDNNGNRKVSIDYRGVKVGEKYLRDYAEVFELATREKVIPGTVMSMVDSGKGLAPSDEPYTKSVVGIISGAGNFHPGMQIGSREDGTSDLPIAIAGQVYVRVTLEGGAIQAGDLLVASSIPGVAMKANDRERAFGAVVGKAIEPYEVNHTGSTEGLVKMLVMNN